jgi:hypothetical protein
MSDRKIIIEHNGETYYGQLATIRRTTLGYEAHGILSSSLHCEWKGGGISVGGYCLDQPKDRDGRDYSRMGTAYGLDFVIRTIETVGVESWEKLTGSSVIVLFTEPNSWGSMASGIAGIHNDKVFLPKEHSEEWKSRVA